MKQFFFLLFVLLYIFTAHQHTCYTEHCTSYSNSVRLFDRLSVTRCYCANTTQATIMRSSLEDSDSGHHDSSFIVVNFTPKFRREHRSKLLMRTDGNPCALSIFIKIIDLG